MRWTYGHLSLTVSGIPPPPHYSLVNKDEYMLINTPVQSVITFNSLGRRFRFVYIYACMCFCVATVFSMNKDLYKECHHFLTVL